MAIAETVILQSIEQLVDGAIGATRTVDTSSVQMGHYPWNGKTLSRPTFDVQVDGSAHKHHQDYVTAISDRRVETLNIGIDIRHHLRANINTDKRREDRASVINIVDELRQALQFPGNLETNSAGTSTGIISGLLMNLDSSLVEEDWQGKHWLHTNITAEAWVSVSQAA